MPKKDGKRAERAAEWLLRETWGCSHVVRAVRARYQRQDMFGCDLLGLTERGGFIAAQVSEAERLNSQRRRRLEEIPWPPNASVYVLQLRQTPDPANRRIAIFGWRVHVLDRIDTRGNGVWRVLDSVIECPKEHFKAWKPREK